MSLKKTTLKIVETLGAAAVVSQPQVQSCLSFYGASYIPAEVAGAKAEADAKRARRARTRVIMVISSWFNLLRKVPDSTFLGAVSVQLARC